MAGRKPFELTLALNLWNTWLAVFSIIGSGVTTVSLFNEICNHGLVASYTVYGQFFEGPSGYLSFLFCISKIAELGDTIILVLRKRPLIFLHWYHHVLTLNYGILSFSEKTPYNTWIIWLNFTVHAVMYSYYLLRSMHFHVPAAIARSITITQILQFIITVLILTHIAYLKLIGIHVDGTTSIYILCFAMEISYIALFGNFFYQSYIKGGGKKFNAEKEALKKNK
uniref:Elongation of very long chain fatty acids protein n=1 Tax=Ascaris suum TaxID=6253 RepID=F1L9G8_ASCSU